MYDRELRGIPYVSVSLVFMDRAQRINNMNVDLVFVKRNEMGTKG